MNLSHIQTELGPDYECQQGSHILRIRTPYLYPDNDLIDIYLTHENSVLTDLGETTRWLDSQFYYTPTEEAFNKAIRDIIHSNDIEIELYEGALRIVGWKSIKDEVELLAKTIHCLTHTVTNKEVDNETQH